jgi:thiamine biosynthesis lipoprotein
LNTKPSDIIQHQFTAMASPCCFHLPQQPGVQALALRMEDEVRRIEQKYSRYQEDSVLSKINHRAGQETLIDAETVYLITYAQACFEQSDGLFDISSGVLRQVWDFKKHTLPDLLKLKAMLPRIGLNRLSLTNNILTMPESMELDFGGIGKEYAADAAARIARDTGIRCGIVDLGGDLNIIGPRLNEHGEELPWQLGVRNPRDPEQAIATLPVYRGGMATSGDYERYFILNEQRYCHLLNPKTGCPAQHWASVTVLAPSCLLAGTLSTIAMLREASATEWLEEQAVHALLIRPNLTMVSLS